MNTDVLTVKMVDELQQVAESGAPTESIVNSLKSATLPGLLEYGCARWDEPSLPSLPTSITDSKLGLSLKEVRSELGLRSSGNQQIPSRTMLAREQEFYVLGGEDSVITDDWGQYLIRFRQSAKNMGFSLVDAKGITASLGEMAENAVIHSESKVGALIGYHAVDGSILYSVVDVGIGVLSSLRSNAAYSHLTTHKDAIRKALETGVTRCSNGGGYGFYSIFKSLAEKWGTLRFRSGEGCVTIDGNHIDVDHGSDDFVLNRAGFQVTVCCRVSESKPPFPLI